LALAVARGAAYRYEQAEALYMLGFYRRTQGQPADDQLIRRCLELSREVGSARCIANAYWTEGVTYADIDAQRAVSALEAGAAVAKAADARFLIGLLPGYVAMVRANLNPVAGLTAFVESFRYLRASGNRLGIRVLLRNMIPAFAAVGRQDLVARIDGAALPFCIRPERVGQSCTEAREGLGDERYEQLRDEGGALSDDDLVELVCREVEHIAQAAVGS
jgi:hypothetical protein